VRVEELDYELPEERIAQYPPKERDGGRLLELGPEGCSHLTIRDFPERVPAGALLVLNDTRVMAARLLGRRGDSDGKVEILVLEVRGDRAFSALAKSKRPLGQGDPIRIGNAELTVRARERGGVVVLETEGRVDTLLERHGHVPLPPYVRRDDEPSDRERYQTVFARAPGSSAAPTAGLHLTEAMLQRLAARGIDVGFVTLHVGVGTFRPVTAGQLCEHPMHEEHYSVSRELLAQLEHALCRGAPVVAVGTTVVRALESAASSGRLEARSESTRLLIAPGYRFRVVDALLTNFHAPRSTLLALVYAFAGQGRVRAAYREALDREYNFLSYGDAMWIPKRQP
jgi:S-adenosylmethionine:tRNA ribosyltransferase-isomerase